ncbi:sensor histidine kinase [Paenibacillus sp. IITD108]|uniref:sensor histidine kinase n=1 Tax=Paenibacillus sp. IITD108 TaxID=3116649 RepID=UPI002F42BC6B
MSKLSYHRRIQLSFLVFIFLPIIAVSVGSYILIKDSMIEKVQLSNDNFLNVINDEIARTIDDISFSSFYIVNDTRFKEYLSDFANTERLNSYNDYQMYKQIEDDLSLITSKTLNYNIRMFLVNRKDFIISSNSEGMKNVQLNLKALLQKVDTKQLESLQWLGLFTDATSGKSNYFIARVIPYLNQKDPASILLISISDSYFEGLLKPVQFGQAALFDSEGKIILNKSDINFEKTDKKNDNLRSEIILDKTGWKLVYETTQEALTGQISRTFYTAIACIIGLFFVFSIFSMYIAKKLYTPIQKLQRVVRQFGMGNLDMRLDVKGEDDIAETSKSINTMLDQLQKLIADIEQEQEQKKVMELEALFMQIRPHFLINTLNSIKFSLMLQKDQLHSGVIDSLMNLLRAYLKVSEPVTLQEECRLLRHYADIMQIRNEMQIDLQFQLDRSTERLIIPKLVLQPVVENAIVHGLVDVPDPKIIVRASWDKQDVVIVIEDNGEGMEQEQLDSLNHLLQNDDPEKYSSYERVGLINVVRRLRLTFDQSVSLTLQSLDTGGTAAIIRIPIQESELLVSGEAAKL